MSEQQEMVERAELRAKIVSRSFAEPKHCPTCGGSGQVEDPDSPRVVHTYRGPFGASNTLDQVLEEFDRAVKVEQKPTVIGQMIFIHNEDGSQLAVDL